MGVFGVQGDNFIIDGKPIQLVSGAIHYFRVVPEYWRDRLLKAKAMGLNAVETYVAWNIHEPEEGKFNFEGIADLEKFIKIAGEVGLHVLLRPSPYICAEWEFGGIPYWVLRNKNVRLRCANKAFLDMVDRYYDELIPRMVPLLCTNGGPIIAMQIENEYGSYGNDKKYLNYLREGLIKRGVDVLLYTSDGPTDLMLNGGRANGGVLQTANFGSQGEECFKVLRKHQKNGPLMCMEYWNGWFDHWGLEHHKRDAKDAAECLDEMLKLGASVNLYMFHGGTNFGFYNGSNFNAEDKQIGCTVTSYDYDSALSEEGDLTPKYHAFKEVISKYLKVEDVKVEPTKKQAYGKVELTESVSMFESLKELSTPVYSEVPLSMEDLGQDYGFTLYETIIEDAPGKININIEGLCDRALVFLDEKYVGTIFRNEKRHSVEVEINEDGVKLQILVENMGRINYGNMLGEGKGILKCVKIGYQFQYGWTMYPLPLKDLTKLSFNNKNIEEITPKFYRGEFNVEETNDTFVLMDGWEKGVVFINGFNLGRYWSAGPQRTLYLPAPLLKKGKNEIVVFELHNTKNTSVELLDKSILG